MNIKMIRALAGIVREAQLTLLEVTEGELHVRIECQPKTGEQIVYAAPPLTPAASATPPMVQEETPKSAKEDAGLDFNDMRSVVSPMVGVFYQASGPGEKPYVSVGQKVKKGDVLCIVEAMKLMNEITADCDGEIFDICVSDGDVVEFGQPLFKLVDR